MVSEIKAKSVTQGGLISGRYRQTHKVVSRKPKQKNAAEQNMTQAIMQEKNQSHQGSYHGHREADNPGNNARPVHNVPSSGSPMLKQLTFH